MPMTSLGGASPRQSPARTARDPIRDTPLGQERMEAEGLAHVAAHARGEYRNKPIGEIRGTGYVVQSLEAALWCFYQTDIFAAAILKAANLGDDTDTTAAVCGQVAGAYYGESGIPRNG